MKRVLFFLTAVFLLAAFAGGCGSEKKAEKPSAKPAAAERDVSIKFVNETKDDSLMVESDEDLLMRIVLNLLENAVRHGRNEDGHIEIRLGSDDKDAIITIADDGEGIPAEVKDKVWDRFYQIEASRSRQDSSGLGLAMVASLVRALGGSIRIVSDSDKKPGELPGAVFELKIPQKNKSIHEN